MKITSDEAMKMAEEFVGSDPKVYLSQQANDLMSRLKTAQEYLNKLTTEREKDIAGQITGMTVFVDLARMKCPERTKHLEAALHKAIFWVGYQAALADITADQQRS